MDDVRDESSSQNLEQISEDSNKQLDHFLNSEFEIREAKNNSPIIFGKDIYWGDSYHPAQEAKNIFEENNQKISQNNKVLLLGLGSGYLLKELIDYYLNENKYFEIYALEPYSEIIELVKKIQQIPSRENNINLIHLSNIEEIYENSDFQNFLNCKPVIIRDKKSFMQSPELFRKFLSYRAIRTNKAVMDKFEKYHIKEEYLQSLKVVSDKMPKIESFDDLLKSANWLTDRNQGSQLFWKSFQILVADSLNEVKEN